MSSISEIEEIDKRILDLDLLLIRNPIDASLHVQKKSLVSTKSKLQNTVIPPNSDYKEYTEVARPPQFTEYDQETEFFALNKGFFNPERTSDMILFCRDEFHALFQHLLEKVVVSDELVYILGSHGVGKTVAVTAFISTLNPDLWQIVWIHIKRQHDELECVIFEPTVKKQFCVAATALSEVLERFARTNLGKLVVLDNVRDSDSDRSLQSLCVLWKKNDKVRNQVIFISSMRARIYAEQDSVKEFRMSAWKQEEFFAAVAYDPLFEQVRSKLDVRSRGTTREELVTAKLFVTGGSVLHMFANTTEEVIDYFKPFIEATKRIPGMPTTLGTVIPEVKLERAVSIYKINPVQAVTDITRTFQSDYEVTLASKFLYDRITADHRASTFAFLDNLFISKNNPALLGWKFEDDTITSLQETGIDFVKKSDREVGHWPRYDLVSYPCNAFPKVFPTGGRWYKPIEYNAAGYDICFINREENYLRIVQITHGKKHDCNLKH
jgi:hypothetical protein